MNIEKIKKELIGVQTDRKILDVLVKYLGKEIVDAIKLRRAVDKWKFSGFSIIEDGVIENLSLEQLIDFEKQGYLLKLELIKPEIRKEISMTFEDIEKE